MSEPIQNPFDLLLERFREVMREEIEAAFAKRRPEKLLYSTKEAADMLGVEESWLATRARAKLIPFRMMGHNRRFSLADIEAITDQSAIDKGGIPVVQVEHDGQGVSADSQKAARVKSIEARSGP